jgi:hypothetical protein
MERSAGQEYNTVVLNLYQLSSGYSLGFNVKSLTPDANLKYSDRLELNSVETKPLSYEENEFLHHVNKGEIPPILIDLIDHINVRQINHHLSFYGNN